MWTNGPTRRLTWRDTVAGRTELVLRTASLSQLKESLPRLSAGGEGFARLTVYGKLELHDPPDVSVLADESDWR